MLKLLIGRFHNRSVGWLSIHCRLDRRQRAFDIGVAGCILRAHLILERFPDRVDLGILAAHQLGPITIGRIDPFFGVVSQAAHLVGQWQFLGASRRDAGNTGQQEQHCDATEDVFHRVCVSFSGGVRRW